MNENLLLMMKDVIVMRINMDIGIYDIMNEELLPYQLRNKFRNKPEFEFPKTRYELSQLNLYLTKNNEAFVSYLASRVLPITRDNAKKVYSLFRFEQLQDEYSKAKIALVCRAVSLQDNYWVKLEQDPVKWENVNLRVNHLNEIVTQVSLHGSSLTLTGEPITPELTGQGAYAKAWKREENELWLYKKGDKGSTESRIEVAVSNILDKCNVNHLHYEVGYSNKEYCCKCKCMTTDTISILPAMDFISYCNRNRINHMQECLKIDADLIYKMWIVDYLISNRDRHGLNWGFFYDCETMEIIGCHPLYDHNNSFDSSLMQNDDTPYLAVENMTMKQAAEYAMKRVDFHFISEVNRQDFLTDRQYESFMRRVKQLGIKTEISNLEN